MKNLRSENDFIEACANSAELSAPMVNFAVTVWGWRRYIVPARSADEALDFWGRFGGTPIEAEDTDHEVTILPD